MEEVSPVNTQEAAHLVASPEEIGHINSAMDMEEEDSVLPKGATLLPEKVGYANYMVEASDVGRQRV